MPNFWAFLTWKPAFFSSSKVNPRPSRILMLYLKPGQRMAGRRRVVGRGARDAARFVRARRRRCFRAGWSNHVRTLRCQSYGNGQLKQKKAKRRGTNLSEMVVGKFLISVQSHDSGLTETVDVSLK